MRNGCISCHPLILCAFAVRSTLNLKLNSSPSTYVSSIALIAQQCQPPLKANAKSLPLVHLLLLEKRLQKRKRRNEDAVDDFKKDPGEYAQRIWQWWGPRCQKFPKHYMAIRLVVLTQTSSCFIERVFSRLKLIRDAVGDNMLEDMTEIRMLLQCNGRQID